MHGHGASNTAEPGAAFGVEFPLYWDFASERSLNDHQQLIPSTIKKKDSDGEPGLPFLRDSNKLDVGNPIVDRPISSVSNRSKASSQNSDNRLHKNLCHLVKTPRNCTDSHPHSQFSSSYHDLDGRYFLCVTGNR